MKNQRTITTSHKNVLETIHSLYYLKGFQFAADEPDIDECRRLDDFVDEILNNYTDRYDGCQITIDRESALQIWSRLRDLREVYVGAHYMANIKRLDKLMALFE